MLPCGPTNKPALLPHPPQRSRAAGAEFTRLYVRSGQEFDTPGSHKVVLGDTLFCPNHEKPARAARRVETRRHLRGPSVPFNAGNFVRVEPVEIEPVDFDSIKSKSNGTTPGEGYLTTCTQQGTDSATAIHNEAG
jgi:hypothetical protein